jgi:Methyltransferase domain
MPRPLEDADFDARYYANGCGRPYGRDEVWFDFFGRIADRIALLEPGLTLDAGCAWGLLVEALRARGVDARGFDISSYAIGQVTPSVRPYCWQASAIDEIDGRYDLIVCMEIFPHLTVEAGHAAIANFCRHADTVLFSASPSDPTAARHRNAQAPAYWAGVFADAGFDPDRSVDVRVMTPWAALFRKCAKRRSLAWRASALVRRLLTDRK